MPQHDTSLNTVAEVWKDTGRTSARGVRYEVSNMGRVRSIREIPWKTTGNEYVRLANNGKKRYYYRNRMDEWDLPDGYEVVDGAVCKTAVLRPGGDGKGYVSVSLCKKSVKVHKLVALAFLGPRVDGMQIDHISGVRDDNRLENLRYLSQSENMINGKRGETHGVYPRGNGIYQVRFKRDNAQMYFGTFKTLDEAMARRDEVLAELDEQMRPEGRHRDVL
jgi:hypothetical protein